MSFGHIHCGASCLDFSVFRLQSSAGSLRVFSLSARSAHILPDTFSLYAAIATPVLKCSSGEWRHSAFCPASKPIHVVRRSQTKNNHDGNAVHFRSSVCYHVARSPGHHSIWRLRELLGISPRGGEAKIEWHCELRHGVGIHLLFATARWCKLLRTQKAMHSRKIRFGLSASGVPGVP